MIVTIDKYIEDLNNNLHIMSRTSNGHLDITSSKKKKDEMLIHDEQVAKEIAIANFNRAIKYAYIHKDDEFKSPQEIKNFIEEIALIITEGIIDKNNLYRHGDECLKYHYVKIKDIPKTIDLFCEKLFNQFKKNYDPIYVAAMSEFYIDMRGHFYMDGCCKTSMIVSAYCLMRKNIAVASYVSRNLYFKYEPRTYENDASDLRRFHKYYKLIHAAKDLWNEYSKNNNVKSTSYDIIHYDYETIDLLLSGNKRAISSLKKIYDIKKKNLPYPNEYKIIFDKKNEVVGIVRVEDVKIVKFKDISYDFALAEAEGDYTLAYWKYAHSNKFREALEEYDISFNVDMEVVCEYIKLVCKVVYE